MILLDTNVLAETMRPTPSPAVIAWLDRHPVAGLGTTAICIAELAHGVARLDDGSRKARLAEGLQAMVDRLAGRILPFDLDAAAHYADIATSRAADGAPIAFADAQIAAIARSRDAMVATRNTRDFLGTQVALVDPWTDG